MRVTLLGTGDTTGTPTVGCDCDTCLAARDDEELRAAVRERGIDPTGGVERSRFSVAVENDTTGESLLVDRVRTPSPVPPRVGPAAGRGLS